MIAPAACRAPRDPATWQPHSRRQRPVLSASIIIHHHIGLFHLYVIHRILLAAHPTMADRMRPAAGGAPRPRPAASGVRRNLFTSQLTRRPTPTSSSNSAEPSRADGAEDTNTSSSDIVVRDQHGEIDLEDPPAPELDEHEDGALDDRQENESWSHSVKSCNFKVN